MITLPGPAAPVGRPAADRLVDTPHGTVHAFVLQPEGRPVATIFDVHGGPEAHDTDSFHPHAQAWLDHGYAVVLVNYRGSSGYGKAWRDAIVGNPGLTELEDVAAVRDALVADGLVDPGRLVLSGRSWGGYLTLLGLGTQPEGGPTAWRWSPSPTTWRPSRTRWSSLQMLRPGAVRRRPDEVPRRTGCARRSPTWTACPRRC